MGLFKCCRSDATSAVDQQAHTVTEVVSVDEKEADVHKEGDFDEDLQAVQWLRDRSLERSLERSLRSKEGGAEELLILQPPSFEAEQAAAASRQQDFPEIKPQDSIEKTPIRKTSKPHISDDDASASHEILEDLLEGSQKMEQMRILSREEADAAERDEMQDRKLEKRRKRERRRKPAEQQPTQAQPPQQQLSRKFSSNRKSKAATISAAATALKLDSSSSPSKRSKHSRPAAINVDFDEVVPATTKIAAPTKDSPSRKKQSKQLQLEPDLQVDSDVDSVSRDRYLIAVQLLHRRIIQKEESLNLAEKDFLNNLLRLDNGEEEESSLAEKLSVIELTLEQLDSSQRLGASPLIMPETVGGEKTVGVLATPDPLAGSNNTNMSLDRKSEVSVYSATSSNSGMGVETTLGGQQRRRSSSSRSKKRTKAEVTRPPLEEQLPTLRPEDEADDDSNEQDEIGALYPILGAASIRPRLLKVRLMEALRGFLPYAVSEENFWLKFSLQRDGASLHTMQHNLQASPYSLIVIQAKDDYQSVFGAFTSSPWRRHDSWYGTGQSFLFKKTDTLEVYPFTGSDNLVQYCSPQMMAIGGGDWDVTSPFSKKEKQGIGLLVDGDLQGGESHSCATFCNPKLTRHNEFSILNMEVWTLTPCMTEMEAEKMEKHKLFVAQNLRQASA